MLRFFGALEGAAGSTGNRQQSWHHSCGMLLPTRANHRPVFGLRQPHFTEPAVLKSHGLAEFGHRV